MESEGPSGLCAFCSVEQELLAWSCEGTLHNLEFLCPVGVTRSWPGAPPNGLYGARGPGEALTGGLWREGDPGSKGWGTDGFAFAVSPSSAAGLELTDGATSSVALFFFVSSPVERIGAAADGGRLMPRHSGFWETTCSSSADVGWSVSGAPGCSSKPSRAWGGVGDFGEKAAVGWSSRELLGRPCWPSTGRGSRSADENCDSVEKKVTIAFFSVG